MKKIIFSTAALMLASVFSFAGTPETKGEAKPEVKTESATIHYRYQSTNPNGSLNFVEGQNNECPPGTEKPCNWESEVPLTSPMTKAQLESNPNVTIVDYRS